MSNKIQTPNIPELLGVTPICMVTDEQIWTHLVTPQVRALLGEIKTSELTVRETVAGDFEGDEVTNYNEHLLYGKQGFVRYPYINSLYRTASGALVIKRDGVKFKVVGWHGKLGKEADMIFKVAIRDRRFDGTPRAHDTSLVDFPIYADAVHNHTLKINCMPENASSVELSVYGFMPGSRILDATGDVQYDRFIASPFDFISKPKQFLRYFRRAWQSKRGPGQVCNPIPDVAKHVANVVHAFATSLGYDYMENASSHYHVAKWAESLDYRYADATQAATLVAFASGIKRLADAGTPLTRSQQSWLCVVQSLPKEHIPKGLDLEGPLWPQDNVGPANLWMYKPLSARAKAIVCGCPEKNHDPKPKA